MKVNHLVHKTNAPVCLEDSSGRACNFGEILASASFDRRLRRRLFFKLTLTLSGAQAGLFLRDSLIARPLERVVRRGLQQEKSRPPACRHGEPCAACELQCQPPQVQY